MTGFLMFGREYDRLIILALKFCRPDEQVEDGDVPGEGIEAKPTPDPVK